MKSRLTEQLKRGDEKAFKYIFNHYYEPLCRFANLFLNDPARAEEIVDDVVFYLWENRDKIDIVSSLRAYLMRAVRNRCLNELKSLTFRSELNFSSFSSAENRDFLENLFADPQHPVGAMLERELEEALNAAIASLPSECQTVFKKSRFEKKKYEEIAKELNISVNTVKYHIKNALAFLQRKLNEYLDICILLFFIGN